MGKALARVFMLLGVLLMASGIYLHLYNRTENRMASHRSAEILAQIKTSIETNRAVTEAPSNTSDRSPYMGYLFIPALELELPVQNSWSYEKLKETPCRFSGTLWEDNLVVMAHNYENHFGRLSTLSPGDEVYFIDSRGLSVPFQIAVMDILPPSAVETVTKNDYDLTLFTCTYGGKNRVVVFCEKAAQT